MTTSILRSMSSLSSNGKTTALPHEDDCCVESLLPTTTTMTIEAVDTAAVSTVTKKAAASPITLGLLKTLVLKVMNAKATISSNPSSSRKPTPASPLKIPGQLPSFPSNITVDTMCSEEDDDMFLSQQHQQVAETTEQLQQHEHELAAARAFLSLEESSAPKPPVAMPLRKVRKLKSNKLHRQLLHSEEELELLLPVRVMV